MNRRSLRSKVSKYFKLFRKEAEAYNDIVALIGDDKYQECKDEIGALLAAPVCNTGFLVSESETEEVVNKLMIALSGKK